jgi:hypothetical protein
LINGSKNVSGAFSMNDKAALRLPRSSKKHWGGFSPHPFVAVFNSMMLERGFSFSTDDKEGEHLYWKKPLFAGYEASVWISPKNTRKNRPEAFGLFISLGIESRRQAFVDRTVRPWECINLREGNRVESDGEKTLVFMGFLDWLAERWEPVATSRGDGWGRWDSMKTEYSEEIARDVFSVYDRQGAAFFDYLGTPIKLANALLDPVGFPGRRPGESLNVSPSGIDPEEYAAVLFHDAGLTDRAKAALESSLRRIEAQVKAGRSDAMDVEIQKCKIERYLRWMQTGDIPQGTVQVEV